MCPRRPGAPCYLAFPKSACGLTFTTGSGAPNHSAAADLGHRGLAGLGVEPVDEQHAVDHLDGVLFVDRLDPDTQHARRRVVARRVRAGQGQPALTARSRGLRLVFGRPPSVAASTARSTRHVVAVVTRPSPSGRGRTLRRSGRWGTGRCSPDKPREPVCLRRAARPRRPRLLPSGLQALVPRPMDVPRHGWGQPPLLPAARVARGRAGARCGTAEGARSPVPPPLWRRGSTPARCSAWSPRPCAPRATAGALLQRLDHRLRFHAVHGHARRQDKPAPAAFGRRLARPEGSSSHGRLVRRPLGDPRPGRLEHLPRRAPRRRTAGAPPPTRRLEARPLAEKRRVLVGTGGFGDVHAVGKRAAPCPRRTGLAERASSPASCSDDPAGATWTACGGQRSATGPRRAPPDRRRSTRPGSRRWSCWRYRPTSRCPRSSPPAGHRAGLPPRPRAARSARVEPTLLDALRCQLLRTRVPPHGAPTVELVRVEAGSGAAGFVNAVNEERLRTGRGGGSAGRLHGVRARSAAAHPQRGSPTRSVDALAADDARPVVHLLGPPAPRSWP